MTNKKNNQGFKETADPLLNKAKKHMAAAQKTKFKKENVSDKSAIEVPDQEDIITLRFENSEDRFAELAEEFEEDNDIEQVIRKDEDEIFVDVPVENSADFIDLLADNDIKVKEDVKPEKIDDKVDDVKATEKVCDNEKKDNGVNSSVKLKTEVDKIIAEAQISWLKPESVSIDTVKAE